MSYISSERKVLDLNKLYWVRRIPVASNNPTVYQSAIDFMVIEGALNDYDALRAISAFRKAISTKQKKRGIYSSKEWRATSIRPADEAAGFASRQRVAERELC